MKTTLILAATLAATLTACGESTPPQPPAPASSAPQAEAPAAPPPVAVAENPATAPVPPAAEPAAAPPPSATPAAAPAPVPAAVPPKPADPALGEQTYRQACAFCHDKGIANAPKLGDQTAWAARLAQGTDALYASALRGKGGMPAKGGNPALTDDAVKAAVDYLAARAR